MNRIVLGSLESVSVPSLGVSDISAKVDTGAWSGALHCTNIREEDGKLYFRPLGKAKLATSVDDYEKRDVRSASGHLQKRYIIPVEIILKDKKYRTTVGLSDRRLMRREMLLGRKFLIENNILVDVTLSLDDDHEVEIGLL